MSIHAVKREQSNLAWDNSIPPILTIPSGSTVSFSCHDASNGQLDASSTSASISALKLELCDQVNGPVYVEGAQPGDTLQIDVLKVQTGKWGWTALIPGFGLLTDEFPEPALKIWDLSEAASEGGQRYAYLNREKGIRVPLRPFAGEMGVARGALGAWSTIPPYVTGGNLDTKHLTEGSTLYLPVEVEGALFSIGDGHAAQGDGEVCGTAIETPMDVSVRLTVRKDRPYTKTPHFSTTITPSTTAAANGEEYYCTTGVDSDIREATRSAVRNMIAYLVAEHGLERVEAYMLCSVAGDLKMHEVVDMPNYVVRVFFLSSESGRKSMLTKWMWLKDRYDDP
ncbi:Acetamidase/Formamidase [Paxillus ammoniavirescens]|nr:Acetamidase/Formamidase [Paxillus ammoniavirescens]